MIYTVFLIPVLIMIVGFIMYKNPPKKINWFVGYRTKNSMNNENAWIEANKYCGKLWMIVGLILFIISIIILILDIYKIINFSEIILTVITLVQVVIMILPIFVVEKRIKDIK